MTANYKHGVSLAKTGHSTDPFHMAVQSIFCTKSSTSIASNVQNAMNQLARYQQQLKLNSAVTLHTGSLFFTTLDSTLFGKQGDYSTKFISYSFFIGDTRSIFCIVDTA